MTVHSTNLTMAANGRVVIPAPMRSELGLQDGSRLNARVVDGAVVLEPVEAAVRRAQAMVAKYIPQDISLSEELVAERHAAAERE